MNTIILVFKNFLETGGVLVNWLITPISIAGFTDIAPISIVSVTGLVGIMTYLIVRSLIA